MQHVPDNLILHLILLRPWCAAFKGILYSRDGKLFNYRNNRDYFIGNNRHRVLFLDW